MSKNKNSQSSNETGNNKNNNDTNHIPDQNTKDQNRRRALKTILGASSLLVVNPFSMNANSALPMVTVSSSTSVTPMPTSSVTPSKSGTPAPTTSTSSTPVSSMTPTPTTSPSSTPMSSMTPTPTTSPSLTPTPSTTSGPPMTPTPTTSNSSTPNASLTPTPSNSSTPNASLTPTPSTTSGPPMTPTPSTTSGPPITPTPSTTSGSPITPTPTPTTSTSMTPSTSVTPTPTPSTSPIILPVELSEFGVREEDGVINLYWKTESEINNKGFEIQRSTNTFTYKKIGWVDGKGNANHPTSYVFEEINVVSNQWYYYRLKQIDFNGISEYSKTIAIMINQKDKTIVKDISPNVVTNNFVDIEISAGTSNNVQIFIHHINGQLISNKKTTIDKGNNTIRMDLRNTPSGMCVVNVKFGKGKSQTKRFVIQR